MSFSIKLQKKTWKYAKNLRPSATIESRALGTLNIASCTRSAQWEVPTKRSDFLSCKNKFADHQYPSPYFVEKRDKMASYLRTTLANKRHITVKDPVMQNNGISTHQMKITRSGLHHALRVIELFHIWVHAQREVGIYYLSDPNTLITFYQMLGRFLKIFIKRTFHSIYICITSLIIFT